MSIRTIIEINHDYLSRLVGPTQGELIDFIQSLAYVSAKEAAERAPQGIKLLRQRHHADKITLEIE